MKNSCVLDTGASCSILNNFENCNVNYLTNEQITIYGINKTSFTIRGVGRHKILENIKVYVIPDFPTSIIAEVDLIDNYQIRFVYGERRSQDQAFIYDKEGLNMIGSFTRSQNNLYTLEEGTQMFLSIREEMFEKSLNKKQVDRMMRIHELHKRSGYTSLDNLHSMLKHNSIKGSFGEGEIDETDVANYQRHMHKQYCNGCSFAKMDSAPASTIDHRSIANKPSVLYADIMHITHDSGQIHYLVGVDEQSSMTFAVLLKNSDNTEVSRAINLIRSAYSKHGHKLENAHLDNERGINNSNTNQVIHDGETDTTYHTPGRHVRKAEVTIKSIKRAFKATILNLEYPCPIALYPYAIKWCVQCLNLVSKEGNNIMAPWTIFTGRKVCYDEHFNGKFGDIVVIRANADDSKRPKTNKPLTTFGIILCREDSMRGTFIIMDLDSKRTVKRRQFKVYRGERNSTILKRIKSIGKASNNFSFGHVIEDEEMNIRHYSEADEVESDLPDPALDVESINNNRESNDDDNDFDESEALEELNNLTESENESDIESIDSNEFEEDLDMLTNDSINDEEDSHDLADMQAPRRKSTRQWTPSLKNLERFMFLTQIVDENLSVKRSIEKFGTEQTSAAVRAEINNMTERGVWSEIDQPLDRTEANIVPSQIFLRAKYDAAGNFSKLKARLVACGNRERMPEHFRNADIESPTANYNNILTLLNLATIKKMHISVMDVAAAYLHADIEGDVYLRLNQDVCQFMNEDPKSKVVKLNKCLYGLRQSGRKWFELLRATFNNIGFKTSQFDSCIFYKPKENPVNNDNFPEMWIAIYVDDIVTFSATEEGKQKVIKHLEDTFGKITIQNGPEFSFLGLRLIQNGDHMIINQSGYAEKITSMIGDEAIGPNTPHRNSFKPIRIDSEIMECHNYKSDVMKLMYLSTRTRPDISYNTSILATRTDPQKIDCDDVNRIMRYIKHTSNEGLRFGGDKVDICLYCDAAFNVHEDRKSQSGFAIFLNKDSAPILFKSKKQSALAQSSTEAEIIALFDAVRHLIIIVNLLEELGTAVNKPIPVWEDNMAVIELISRDKILKGNARFIDRKYLSTRDYVKDGTIKLQYVNTFNQVADSLTKAISGQRFIMFKQIMLGTYNYSAEQSEMDDK